jgi:hypothetical protein
MDTFPVSYFKGIVRKKGLFQNKKNASHKGLYSLELITKYHKEIDYLLGFVDGDAGGHGGADGHGFEGRYRFEG